MHITHKLIKLWRILGAFSFKKRCNLRESDKILNICKKNWDFLDNLLYFSPVLLSFPLWPFPELAKFCDTCIYIYWSDSSVGSRGGPPGEGGGPLNFLPNRDPKGRKTFFWDSPPPPHPLVSEGLDPPLDKNAQKMLAIVGITLGVRDGSC